MSSINNNKLMRVKDCQVGDIIEVGIANDYLEDIHYAHRSAKVTVFSFEEEEVQCYFQIAWNENLKLANNTEKDKLSLQFRADKKGFKYASYFNKYAYCRLVSRPKTLLSIPIVLGMMLLSTSIKQEVLNASIRL